MPVSVWLRSWYNALYWAESLNYFAYLVLNDTINFYFTLTGREDRNRDENIVYKNNNLISISHISPLAKIRYLLSALREFWSWLQSYYWWYIYPNNIWKTDIILPHPRIKQKKSFLSTLSLIVGQWLKLAEMGWNDNVIMSTVMSHSTQTTPHDGHEVFFFNWFVSLINSYCC